jgi:hypothetical protein
MMVVYEKRGHVVVSHARKANYIHFDWSNFYVTLDEIKTLHAAALERARASECFYYVADTAKVKNALRQDVIQWWGEVWVPILAKYGLKAIITVVPQAALAQLSTKRWQGHVMVQGIELVEVTSLTEAEAFIRNGTRSHPR